MPKLVTDAYSELAHYTSGNGLAGILTSGCVWATHASFLNDSEEIKHFFDKRLMELVRPAAFEALTELAQRPGNAERIASDGGFDAVVEAQAESMVSILRSTTRAVNQPHVFSLCSTKDAWVADHGLLSQWRGYGQDGGYAVVFDTQGLERLFQEEAKSFHYQNAQWGDVYYYGMEDADQPAAGEIDDAEVKLKVGIRELMRDPDPSKLVGMYQAVTKLSCYYKHRGFFEEREVRVVFIPTDERAVRRAQQGGENLPEKVVRSFTRAGLLVPYIELFSRAEVSLRLGNLPIKRVIVGPHRDKELRAEAVEKLLRANGYTATVSVSDIPYIGC